MIINLTSELVARGCEVMVVDISDGFISKNLNLKGIPFYFCSIESVKDLTNIVKPTDIYVSFGNIETDLRVIKDLYLKIYYWQVHPDFLSLVFRIRNGLIPKRFQIQNPLTLFFRNKLYKQLISNNAISIMSESHLRFARLSERNTLINNILPIPISNLPASLAQERKADGNLNIVYIGRPQDWKILPFLVVLRDLNNLNANLKSRIRIFVVTTEKEMFQQFIKNYKIENSLDIKYELGFSLNSLELFLKDNADLVFSMGTSLLDAGKLGVPCVFADAIFLDDISFDYKYRWLYETNGYNLGNPIYSINDVLDGLTIDEIISSIINKDENYNIRVRCYEYVKKLHDIGIIVNRLISLAENSRLISKDLLKYKWFFTIKKSRREIISRLKNFYLN